MQKSLNLFRNFVELCKGLRLPTPVRHPLLREGNKVSYIVSRKEETHPKPSLGKGGGHVSCAKHTEKNFSSFTSHFSQLRTPHPNPLPQGAREQLSCAKQTEKDLFTYLPIHLFTFKKCAFTLAEVLITLGIIGVVAAITVPTVIANNQKQIYVKNLQKGINTVSNMLKKMQADEEASSLADISLIKDGTCPYIEGGSNGCEDLYGNPSIFENLIPKYIKTVKTCKNSDCDIYYNVTYFSCQNNKCTLRPSPYSHTLYNYEDFILGYYTSDGLIYYFSTHASGVNRELIVYIDTNGEKGPNTFGRDLFSLYFDTAKVKYSSDIVKHIRDAGWKMDY